MKPKEIKSKIFLDSGNPEDTKLIYESLGFLDGQTTNPSLLAKNTDVVKKVMTGEKYNIEDLYLKYKEIIQEINRLLPGKDISVEVYADSETRAEEIVKQAFEMNKWIEGPFIKIPIMHEGLKAAEILSKEGVKLNMTLCFSQEQAAAVYSATKGAQKGAVYISPFEGRLDDVGKDGMDLITNILDLYENGDGHVEVLAASIRDVHHLMYSIYVGVDAVTVPTKHLVSWINQGKPLLTDDIIQDFNPIIENKYLHEDRLEISDIEDKKLDITLPWKDYIVTHPLTESGLGRFAKDWNSLLK